MVRSKSPSSVTLHFRGVRFNLILSLYVEVIEKGPEDVRNILGTQVSSKKIKKFKIVKFLSRLAWNDIL